MCLEDEKMWQSNLKKKKKKHVFYCIFMIATKHFKIFFIKPKTT